MSNCSNPNFALPDPGGKPHGLKPHASLALTLRTRALDSGAPHTDVGVREHDHRFHKAEPGRHKPRNSGLTLLQDPLIQGAVPRTIDLHTIRDEISLQELVQEDGGILVYETIMTVQGINGVFATSNY